MPFLRPLLILVLVVAVSLTAVSVVLFITYADDLATSSDAVIVLAGNKQRLPVALELMRREIASTLVVSDGLDPLNPLAKRVCTTPQAFPVLCPKPDPFSTRGEARLIAELAAEHGWSSIVVVSSRFHLFRARLLIERCYDGRLALVGAPIEAWRQPIVIAFEWGKLGRAGIVRSC